MGLYQNRGEKSPLVGRLGAAPYASHQEKIAEVLALKAKVCCKALQRIYLIPKESDTFRKVLETIGALGGEDPEAIVTYYSVETAGEALER